MHGDFSKELQERVKRDFDHRNLLIKESRLTDDYDPEMERIHIENALWLDNYAQQNGWPDKKELDGQSWENLTIIIFHAISCPDFMRKARNHFSALDKKDQSLLQFVACLEDRISYHEGRPQTYGSVVDWDENGEMCIPHMTDSAIVNKNRARIGWGTVEEHLAGLKAEYSRPPADFAEKKKKAALWSKKTGWHK